MLSHVFFLEAGPLSLHHVLDLLAPGSDKNNNLLSAGSTVNVGIRNKRATADFLTASLHNRCAMRAYGIIFNRLASSFTLFPSFSEESLLSNATQSDARGRWQWDTSGSLDLYTS